jgi:hypothetical protein
MKNDSISASSKIKELVDLHKSGTLSDKEYHAQLKSWILSQLKNSPLEELKTEKESVNVSKENFHSSSRKFKEDKYDLLKSEIIDEDADLPQKERVEKILWIRLN